MSQKIKPIEELTIAEVVEMDIFINNLSDVILGVKKLRAEKIQEMRENNPYRDINFRRGAVVRLEEKKVHNARALSILYRMALDKTLDRSEYPSLLRDYIIYVGDQALQATVQQLKVKSDG